MSRTFLFFTEFGEILDVALELKRQGESVLFYIENDDYRKIGDGLIEKVKDWHQCLGEGYIWVIDGCSHGNFQDWLRENGEHVFGGSEAGDALENDRQLGQKLFKKLGFKQPESHNFTSIDDALSFVQENEGRRFILKQNGNAPKSINHMTKFEDCQDMIVHLEHLKKSWNETEYGAFDCDLMEVIEGTEIAASAFFNGHDWMRDKDGKVVGFLNGEEKKEISGNLGETTGEMGTVFLGCDEDNDLFADILLRDELKTVLEEAGFRGVFDINGTVTEDSNFVGFEPTCRFGVPASSYELIEGLNSSLGDLIESVAKGEDSPIDIKKQIGMVMVVAAKPFPVEAHLEDDATSMGEVLWFLDEDGQEGMEPDDEQLKHIHLYNFFKNEDTGRLKVATDNGYLLTVTGTGRTISGVRSDLIDYIKSNIYISGMKYRDDIGKRLEQFMWEVEGEKPYISIDFDNVIHEYDEYNEVPDGEMIDGTEKAIKTFVKKGYCVSVFTARTNLKEVKKWFDDAWPEWREYIDEVTNTKRPAVAYIDDRAVSFTSWEQVGVDIVPLLTQ